jgi:hypothetical protein
MENKIKELKIRMLKEPTKRKAIRKEIARLITKKDIGGAKK